MAHSITNKLRGTLAAFIALVAALLLVPGTAFADPAVMGAVASSSSVLMRTITSNSTRSLTSRSMMNPTSFPTCGPMASPTLRLK